VRGPEAAGQLPFGIGAVRRMNLSGDLNWHPRARRRVDRDVGSLLLCEAGDEADIVSRALRPLVPRRIETMMDDAAAREASLTAPLVGRDGDVVEVRDLPV
jgi:hypothetical protein